MTHSQDCPCGRSQFLTPLSGDTIAIDRETFRQIFSLLNRSVDILSISRHHEIFIQSLDAYLSESLSLDGSQLFKASLLLDVWMATVPDNLQELAVYLDEVWQMMSVISAASRLGGSVD